MERALRIVAIVQSRMGSTRLPGKALKEIVGKTMIELLLLRLSKSKQIDEIVVATSDDKNNDQLQEQVEILGFQCIRGSENDVLSRFYEAAKLSNADAIVRITGDCPLIDSAVVDECISQFKRNKSDYSSNIDPASYPDGLDVEVISFDSIERAFYETNSKFDREHVTPYIRNSKNFTKTSLRYKNNLSSYRWTVDEPEDLLVIKNIFEYFSPSIFFEWEKVLELTKTHPHFFESNKNIINNEGSIMGTGQKLYKRAKKIIPGGNMLLSKRPEMFLPEKWPSYYSKAKGCRVYDLDGNEFIDMSIMGIGTNILGYGHPEIDEAVVKTVKDGNMSTLNCPEEVYLAEKLIELHPWASMVRLARTGGEINSVAIRIARAFTGKDKIAICGYHGWHDWYLASNLNDDKNLDGHLLPGLCPNGVPRVLAGTTLPFDYNKIEQLEQIIKNNKNEIAAIKMEVSRNEIPEHGYLQKVRDLATENSILLIFDECTSGFRETFGGLHKKYKVEPDMALFGKALGNGYAISACIGKQECMQSAQKTFISSTFWTERIGPTAAIKTLEIMEREKSWQKITKIGKDISNRWVNLANKHDLEISLFGMPALSSFSFNSKNAILYKTFITQEMLKKGFLASNSVYVSLEHKKNIVDEYFSVLDQIFKVIEGCENGMDINKLLDGPSCHSGFQRLN
jgi:glutamate-1-semialdehyde 2,1-aminomutase